MAFNTSALSTWVKPGELFSKALYKASTSQYVDIIDGVKGYMDIHPVSTTTVFQAGACSYNSTNTTVVGAIRLTVDQISTMETFCVSDFNTFAVGQMLKPGTSDQDDEAFVGMFAEEKLQSATNALWEMFWKGNKVSGSGNNALTNGILYQLVHTANSASTVSATSAVTNSNAAAVVDYMIENAPAALFQKGDLIIYTTSINYRKLAKNLKDNNNFNYAGGEINSGMSLIFPNTNIKVIGLPEMDGNADGIDFVMTYKGNFAMGTDTAEESTSYDLWYSKDDRNIKSALETKIGTIVKEPAMVVIIA